MPSFTPTQIRLLRVLSDGRRHTKDELRACLGDDQAVDSTLRVHLTLLRKKLLPIGEDIATECPNRRFLYRHVRLLTRGE